MKRNPLIGNPITEGNILRELLIFFLPLFMGNLAQQSYNIIDAVIVGNFAGKEGLAAIDAPFAFINLTLNIYFALAAGASIAVAQSYGARRWDEVSRTVHTVTVFAVISGFVVMLVGLVFAPPFVSMMEVPADIRPTSIRYLRIYFLGSIFSALYNVGSGILRSIGDSKRPFYYLLIASAVNIVLDWYFVAILRWGAVGAGVATVIAQAVSVFFMALRLMKTEDCYGIRPRLLRMEGKTLWLLLKLGIPIGAQGAMFSLSNMFMQQAVNRFGTDYIAAWSIGGKTDFLLWAVTDTMGVTVMTFVAQNYGAGLLHRARKCTWLGGITAISFSAFLSFILYTMIPVFARAFNSDPVVIGHAVMLTRIMAPFYFLYGFSAIFSGAIRGYGETMRPMLITLFGTCIFRIVWVFAALAIGGIHIYDIIWVYPCSWLLTSGSLAIYYFLFMRKKERSMKADESKVEAASDSVQGNRNSRPLRQYHQVFLGKKRKIDKKDMPI